MATTVVSEGKSDSAVPKRADSHIHGPVIEEMREAFFETRELGNATKPNSRHATANRKNEPSGGNPLSQNPPPARDEHPTS